MKYIIWSNRNLDLEDWKEYLAEEYPDVTDKYEQYALMEECNNRYLDYERANLNQLVDGRILVLADLGLWYGRRQGYKILGRRISDILYDDCEYVEWYSDGHNIRATASHHDGVNVYEYRVIREDRNVERLFAAMRNGEEITRARLNYYTKSLHPYVAKVYGWS